MQTHWGAGPCGVHEPEAPHTRERRVRLATLLTAVMMLVEIVAGYATQSMALLADGWHMATHVGALGVASLAYAVSRKLAAHPSFSFGTGKVHALAGYTSALSLGLVALAMIVESVSRLLQPTEIDFAASLPVAVIGLLVNLGSFWILDVEEEEHRQGGHAHHHGGHTHHHEEPTHQHHEHRHPRHAHDHNHRAALMHVLADTVTSAFAVIALLAGRWLDWAWLDPVSGILGALLILKWGFELCRGSGAELLDFNSNPKLTEEVRARLEQLDDVRVRDLHVWSIGRGRWSCVVTLASATPREVIYYREHLNSMGLAHLTIEVWGCATPAAIAEDSK